MKKQSFSLAMEIISECHNVEMIVNRVEPNGQVMSVLENPTIEIKSCTSKLIGTLLAHHFTLRMSNGLLSVDEYSGTSKHKQES